MKLLEKLPKDLLKTVHNVKALAEEEKLPVFLVGGIVRDLFIGSANLDLDFVVEGPGIDFAKRFARKYKGDCKPYYKFQTATVFLNEQRVDFATAREEIYPEPGSYPKVSQSTLDKDLKRRDFTINAMAIALNAEAFGTLIDPYNGVGDLEKRKIRILHEASFKDDPTRILRAVRYEQRLDFNIEKQTLKALKNAVAMGALQMIPPQRLKQEKKKISLEPNPDSCLKRLQELGGSAIMSGF